MVKKKQYTRFAVLGLGHFGMSIVQALSQHDVDIMACDKDEIKLQRAAEYATHVVQVDVTDENALEKLGLGNFEAVVLAMGDDFEASQIAAMIAKENGVRHVVVTARNRRQKTILESMGVNEVVLPEHEMGAKLARKLAGYNIMDILEESSFYTITEMRPLDEWLNKTVQEADIRRKHNLTILAIRHGDKLHIPVLPDTVITEDNILIALSETRT
jgi:trk system potassium uptake protein TrkA